jgi:hypothetical protein
MAPPVTASRNHSELCSPAMRTPAVVDASSTSVEAEEESDARFGTHTTACICVQVVQFVEYISGFGF